MSDRRAIVALVVGTLIAVGIAELAVRVVLPHPSYYRGHPGNVPGLVTTHDVREYTWTPGFQGTMTTADFSNEYSINAQGLRDLPVEQNGAHTILAVGDSFTAGEGVEAHETWPRKLQEVLNAGDFDGEEIRVVNAGVTGYSARQMRQMAQELIPVYQPTLVVAAIYPRAVDRIANPFVLHGGHLVRSGEVANMTPVNGGFIWFHSDFYNERAAAIDIWSQKHLHFLAHIIKTVQVFRKRRGDPPDATVVVRSRIESGLAPLLNELSAFNTYLRRDDVRLIILVVSGQESDGEISAETRTMAQVIIDYCDLNGIAAVSPIPLFEDVSGGEPVLRFESDGHWSPLAHQTAAGYLGDLLLTQAARRGCVERNCVAM
jgi:hypothetical protein